MISSLVSLHDSCKNRDEIAKGDSWLTLATSHNTLHKQPSFKTSQPDYGRRSKRKKPKQHKATGQDRILVEEPLLIVETSQAYGQLFIELPVKN